ncbi:MAG: aminotransferase class IV family protein [Sedimentisphaerales bacterium]|nr:aminotransferase class IV family protein [Sedimentisphaerales bacterium]
MEEFVFLNDGLVAADAASVSIYDGGLLHGVGLFETMRSYNGVVFHLEDHLDRLYRSATVLNFPITQPQQEIAGWIDTLLKANDLRDARLRLTVTRGNLHEVKGDGPPTTTLFITATKMTPYPPELYQRGMSVIISEYKQNPDDPITGHKTTNYLSRLIALQQAQQKGAGEALWFTTTNRLAEGCVSNVFIVQDDCLVTPPLDTPVLDGIARRVVCELAKENDISVRQEPIVISELLSANEVFLTNSIMELMPVCRIERHAVGEEKPGPVYTRLHELYRQKVDEACQSE